MQTLVDDVSIFTKVSGTTQRSDQSLLVPLRKGKPTQGPKCEFMYMDEQSTNQE